jgi:hypothetical protein
LRGREGEHRWFSDQEPVDRNAERYVVMQPALPSKRGRSVTLLGGWRLVPDVVGYGRGRHAKARFAGRGCSYDGSYEPLRAGYRGEHARQAPSLDGRAEASDRGRRHGAGGIGGDGGSQARHQQRAVLCLAATVGAARRRDRPPAAYGRRRCGAGHAASGARDSCTVGVRYSRNGGRAGAARSTRRSGQRDVARWCGCTAGQGFRC